MKEYQERVIIERKELDIKRDKLTEFIKSHVFLSLDSQEQARLMSQHEAMLRYSSILAERIANFK